ncbi:MAG: ferredoxin-type protein NapF [Rhizobiaceae bacterium]
MSYAARGANQSRRGFALSMAGMQHEACLRPPWTTENRVRENCTSCGDCIRDCPESILVSGPAGTPVVDFSLGACTFCSSCAEACGEDVFRNVDTSPWSLKANIGQSCLLNAGISCQSCTDACDDMAIRFDMRAGPVGKVQVLSENCTGCGACVSVCPAKAIQIHTGEAGTS